MEGASPTLAEIRHLAGSLALAAPASRGSKGTAVVALSPRGWALDSSSEPIAVRGSEGRTMPPSGAGPSLDGGFPPCRCQPFGAMSEFLKNFQNSPADATPSLACRWTADFLTHFTRSRHFVRNRRGRCNAVREAHA